MVGIIVASIVVDPLVIRTSQNSITVIIIVDSFN